MLSVVKNGRSGISMRGDAYPRLVDIFREVAAIDDSAALLVSVGTLQTPHVTWSDRCRISTKALVIDGISLPIGAAIAAYADAEPRTVNACLGGQPGLGHELRHRLNEQTSQTWGLSLDAIHSLTLTALSEMTPSHLWPLLDAYTTATPLAGLSLDGPAVFIDRLLLDAGYTLTTPEVALSAAA